MNNSISFGAKFAISPSGYEERIRYTNEGLGEEKIAQLSAELDSRTPKNYKMVLSYRDRNREEDSFILRKRTKDGWNTVADYVTQPMSSRALSVERLQGIFNILKLKEQHKVEQEKMDKRLAQMNVRHSEEMKEAVRMFDKNA